MSSKFSGIIQINDLDDFIGPGQVNHIILIAIILIIFL